MKSIKRTKQFKKDVKRMQKQRKDFGVLKQVIENLAHRAKRVEIGRTSPKIATILNGYGYCSIFFTQSAP